MVALPLVVMPTVSHQGGPKISCSTGHHPLIGIGAFPVFTCVPHVIPIATAPTGVGSTGKSSTGNTIWPTLPLGGGPHVTPRLRPGVLRGMLSLIDLRPHRAEAWEYTPSGCGRVNNALKSQGEIKLLSQIYVGIPSLVEP